MRYEAGKDGAEPKKQERRVKPREGPEPWFEPLPVRVSADASWEERDWMKGAKDDSGASRVAEDPTCW